MDYNQKHFIAAKDCPFTYKGKNLAELRRAKLRKIATAIGIEDNNKPKNDILAAMVVRLKTIGSEKEIA